MRIERNRIKTAFLQGENLKRQVYVEPPIDANNHQKGNTKIKKDAFAVLLTHH